MKELLSHLQVTPKNVLAFASAVLGYFLLKGKITNEEMQAYLLIVGTALTILVPSRAPTANQEPGTVGNTDLSGTEGI